MIAPVFLFVFSPALAADDIVFVGNSYTIGNDLPGTVAGVYEAAGDSAVTAKLAAGGLTLADHAVRAADVSTPWYTKLVAEAADREWVVLQDQSQIPGFPVTQPEWGASRDGGVALDVLVDVARAETVFFLTWGRRDGDDSNAWRFPDFSTMQGHLTDGYTLYAEACATEDRPVWIAPAGPVFAKIHDDIVAAGDDPTDVGSLFFDLYAGDGSHPSRLGTQLTAYVFYAALTGNSPVGLPVPEGLDATKVETIQAAVAAVVFDTTDAFDFPWEIDAPVDTTPTDSGEPDEPDEPVDSGLAPVDDDGGPVDVGSGANSDTEKDSGCATAGSKNSFLLIVTSLFLVVFRRRAPGVASTATR